MSEPALRLFHPEGSPPPERDPGITVSQIIILYLAYLYARRDAGDFSQGAIDRITRRLHEFETVEGSRPVSQCRQHHFTRWWLSGFNRWKSDYTKRDAKDSILGCFKWAEDEELIDRSPFRKPRFRLVTTPKQPFRNADYLQLMTEAMPCFVRRPLRFDLAEFRRRRRRGSLQLRQACFFLMHTGARPSEMREAEWSEFSEDRGFMELFDHKTARATGKSRIIGLSDRVMKFLRRMKVGQAPSAKIFSDGYGDPWNKDSFGRHFRRHADRAGLDKKLSAYCLRHGFITQAVENGLSSREIADQVGHETTRMVDHYARTTRRNAEHLKRVAERATQRKRKSDDS